MQNTQYDIRNTQYTYIYNENTIYPIYATKNASLKPCFWV